MANEQTPGELAAARNARLADAAVPATEVTRVLTSDLRDLLSENEQLRKQRDELQTRMTEMVERSLARRVRAFHTKFGHPVRHTPAVPPDEEVRFRLALISEEFFELLSAAINQNSDESFGEFESIADAHEALRAEVSEYVRLAPVSVNLVEFYDAMLDLAYVVEGTHAVSGTDATPGFDEVQRANMSKDAVYVEEKDGFKMGRNVKPVKPAGWEPPRIAQVLAAQGWEGGGVSEAPHGATDAITALDVRHPESKYKLYDADPNCQHEIETQWSGVKCRKCGGWFCL